MTLTVGEKIGLLRKERNITQTALAEYLFLAPQTVSRWEVGSGAPEITLLPKIAAFFGVSIDELFGLTSVERADDLVCKYSVLRDDRSFQEAMECVNSQLQTINAALNGCGEDTAELEVERDRLESLKVHLWIQQGREAFQRALTLVDRFVEKTEGNPAHPWHLPMRLQKNQLQCGLGKGRETLAACEKAFAARPDVTTLYIYAQMLVELQRYEDLLAFLKAEAPIKTLLQPVSEENLSIWELLIHAAAGARDAAFLDQHLPAVLAACGREDEYWLLMGLLDFYREAGREDSLAACRQRLLELLPEVPQNKYFAEKAREKIEQA